MLKKLNINVRNLQVLQEKNKYIDYAHAAAFNPQNVAVSNYDTEDARKVMAITSGKKYVFP